MVGRVRTVAIGVLLAAALSAPAVAQTTFQPEVTGVESGVHDGRFWVRVEGTGPLPSADEVYSAFIAALVIDGSGRFFSGYHQVHDGEADTFTDCSDGSDAQCPSDPVPLEVVTLPDGPVVFYFDFPDDVDLSMLEYGAETGRLETEDSDFERMIYPSSGPVEASIEERDPTSSDVGAGGGETSVGTGTEEADADDEAEDPGEEATTATAEPAASDDGGIPWGLIGIALALLGTATAVVVGRSRTRTRDCTPQQQAYDAARRAYDAAREAQAHWEQERSDRRHEEIRLESAIRRGSPAVAGARPDRGDHPEGADGDAEHAARLAAWEADQQEASEAEAQIDAARADVEEAAAKLAEADAAVDAARDTLEAARVALQECLGSPMDGVDDDTTTPDEPTAPPVAPPTSPTPRPATRTRQCEEGTRRNWTSTRLGPVQIMVDFEVRLAEYDSSRNVTEAEAAAMALSLSELAALLGMLDEGLPDSTDDIRDHLESLDDRLRTIHDEGLGTLLQSELKDKLRGDVEGAITGAAGDLVESATGVAPSDVTDALDSIPKSPWKVPIKVLKFTAELGEIVAHFCGRVIQYNTSYQVEVRTQTMMVDVLRREGEVCEGGRWVHRRRLDSFVGTPTWGDWRAFQAERSGDSRHWVTGPDEAQRLLKRVLGHMERRARRDLGQMGDLLQE